MNNFNVQEQNVIDKLYQMREECTTRECHYRVEELPDFLKDFACIHKARKRTLDNVTDAELTDPHEVCEEYFAEMQTVMREIKYRRNKPKDTYNLRNSMAYYLFSKGCNPKYVSRLIPMQYQVSLKYYKKYIKEYND